MITRGIRPTFTKDIVLLDLFSGIGGFSKGLYDGGFNIVKHYYSEIDKHAIACYKYNFKNSIYAGDVTNLGRGTIEHPNIITFGSPCQDFSMAGKRAGMEGQRSSLIGEALRLIAECRPDIFIWENVKGVFSSNSGKDFWAIIQAFTDIGGYRLEWQLLNTAWVLPQNRERIYLIGHLAENSRRLIFPIGEDNAGLTEGTTKTTNVGCLSAGGHSGGMHSSMTLVRHRSDQPYKQADCSPTIRNSDKAEVRIVAQRGRGENNEQQLEQRQDGVTNSLTGVQKDNLVLVAKPSRTDEAKKIRSENMKKGKDYTPFQGKKIDFIESDNMNTITGVTTKDNLIIVVGNLKGERGHNVQNVISDQGISPTVRSNHGSVQPVQVEHDYIIDENYSSRTRKYMDRSPTIHSKAGNLKVSNIRRLTEIECERLQGFEDNWTEYGDYDGVIKKIPKSQRYKLLGNAVTVKIVELIGKNLLL